MVGPIVGAKGASLGSRRLIWCQLVETWAVSILCNVIAYRRKMSEKHFPSHHIIKHTRQTGFKKPSAFYHRTGDIFKRFECTHGSQLRRPLKNVQTGYDLMHFQTQKASRFQWEARQHRLLDKCLCTNLGAVCETINSEWMATPRPVLFLGVTLRQCRHVCRFDTSPKMYFGLFCTLGHTYHKCSSFWNVFGEHSLILVSCTPCRYSAFS